MDFSPKSLKLTSSGRWVTVVLEVDNNRASGVQPCIIELHVPGRGFVRVADLEFPPQLGDADGDGNADLTANSTAPRCRRCSRCRRTTTRR
jgi:hypothetical protein